MAKQEDRPITSPRIACQKRSSGRILDKGFAFHDSLPSPFPSRGKGRIPRRPDHNLLRRLTDRNSDVLRLLSEPSVPFTNNQAERDGRMMKLRQKISGGFRSLQGAQDFATIRTLLSTAQKRTWNLIDTLKHNSRLGRFIGTAAIRNSSASTNSAKRTMERCPNVKRGHKFRFLGDKIQDNLELMP
jgi:transposase